MSEMGYFSRKIWSIVIDSRRFRCPKGLRDNLLAWRELFANLCQLKSRIRFWEEYNYFKRIYTDVTDFPQISPKNSGNNEKRKRVKNFDI